MIGKMDQVLEYIEALLPGARVSVRQLAKELSVSEGTAYKAIRCAKEKGLVQSKPKSGTVRVASDHVHNEKARPAEDFVSDRAGDWMQEPLYLYHDDVAADWHRLYRGMFSAFSKCAVVDDDRKICGTVDALQVNSAELTSKISSMYMSEGSCLVEDEDIPVSVLADSMAKANTSLAYLTRNGVVSGVITASDLLRYYRLKVKGDFIVGDAAVFEVVGYNKKIGQIEYRVQLSHATQAGTRYNHKLLELFVGADKEGLHAAYPAGLYYEQKDNVLSRYVFVHLTDESATLSSDSPFIIRELPAGKYLCSKSPTHQIEKAPEILGNYFHKDADYTLIEQTVTVESTKETLCELQFLF